MSGSSPHTRGALASRTCKPSWPRIIPAYAGSTSCLIIQVYTTADHPRIRGEHESEGLADELLAGSSPHTRGARLIASWWAFRSGIIPAYAGSTTSSRTPGCRSGDHPRIRGEHFATSAAGQTLFGSSPHTRGALNERAARQRRKWIIPAYAGSTRLRVGRRCRGGGSSPHTRGARQASPEHGVR